MVSWAALASQASSEQGSLAMASLAAREKDGAPGPQGAPDLLLRGLALLIAKGPVTGTAVAKQALEAFRRDAAGSEECLWWSWLAARTATFIWDYDTWAELTRRQADAARAAGALSILPLTLSTIAGVQLFAGRLSEAESFFEQAEALADATETRTVWYASGLVAAFRGYEREAREYIDAAARDFAARGEGMGVSLTRSAKAALCNGLARYDEAYAAAEQALEDRYEPWFWPWATVELIEAASRTGRATAARPAFERLAESTTASGTAWAAAVEDRCRALLSQGARAEALYRGAIDLLAPTALRLDLARTPFSSASGCGATTARSRLASSCAPRTRSSPSSAARVSRKEHGPNCAQRGSAPARRPRTRAGD